MSDEEILRERLAKLEAQHAETTRKVAQLVNQLEWCETAAREGSVTVRPGEVGWSDALGAVITLRDRFHALQRERSEQRDGQKGFDGVIVQPIPQSTAGREAKRRGW